MEFSERFYPDLLVIGGLVEGVGAEEPLYYDAALERTLIAIS